MGQKLDPFLGGIKVGHRMAPLVGSAFLGETLGLGFQQIHSDARQGCEAGCWAGSSG